MDDSVVVLTLLLLRDFFGEAFSKVLESLHPFLHLFSIHFVFSACAVVLSWTRVSRPYPWPEVRVWAVR